MALSNWDVLGVNKLGHTGISMTSPSGIVAQIYKNKLHILDHDARPCIPGAFIFPVVMVIREGSCQYQDLYVEAIRGPQDGIYVACWMGWIDQAEELMVGCGVYGFDDAGVYVGVEPASLEYLRTWRRKTELPPEVRAVNLASPRRFNQGDVFLAEAVGKAAAGVATPVGEQAEQPILLEAIQGDAER